MAESRGCFIEVVQWYDQPKPSWLSKQRSKVLTGLFAAAERIAEATAGETSLRDADGHATGQTMADVQEVMAAYDRAFQSPSIGWSWRVTGEDATIHPYEMPAICIWNTIISSPWAWLVTKDTSSISLAVFLPCWPWPWGLF